MPETRVVAAVVRRHGRFLVCRRPTGKRHAGLWEFPGGKRHPGESLLQAARRELAEELGVRVTTVSEVRFAIADAGTPFVIEFVDAEIEGEPLAHEHDAVAWHTARELNDLPLAPGDRHFVQHLGSSGS